MVHTIIFIDAYDSYSNNIIALLYSLIPDLLVCKITIHDPLPSLVGVTALVLGPGPGHPEIENDVGCMRDVWRLKETDVLPVLGICLGFQSLCAAFGAEIIRLPLGPRHGVETELSTSGSDIFAGITSVKPVLYNSLCVDVLKESDSSSWTPSKRCPDLVPLAWDAYSWRVYIDDQEEHSHQAPKPVLMAARHISKPFWAVQFHPESICSNDGCKSLVLNWWNAALSWLSEQKERRASDFVEEPSYLSNIREPRRYSTSSQSSIEESLGHSERRSSHSSVVSDDQGLRQPRSHLVQREMDQDNLKLSAIREALHSEFVNLIILDSEMRQIDGLGRYSIIGFVAPDTIRIEYYGHGQPLKLLSANETVKVDLGLFQDSSFVYLKQFMAARAVTTNDSKLPFAGGLMGYITYEAGLETINVNPVVSSARRPLLAFAFIERSVVIDHKMKQITVQSIKDNDGKWLDSIFSSLEALKSSAVQETSFQTSTILSETTEPNPKTYSKQINQCLEEIRAGNSYELCLTGQTKIKTPKQSSWETYQRLRKLNPAPFGAYIQLGGATVLSSSPERFLSWSRPDVILDNTQSSWDLRMESICQFRPIKGTVRKKVIDECGQERVVSRDEAEQILKSQKERAENLMIVDLIRHDLYGVAGSYNVAVPQLMKVEEYETVYQLVSVIEGSLKSDIGLDSNIFVGKTGLDVLAASLPPGSMTGAPKKRSCELLRGIEDGPRSIYSGVLGYIDVGGGGDFSVVIRTAFKWDDEDTDTHEKWRIGAGGAITCLSSVEGEYDEMLGKLNSTLAVFKA